MFKGMIVLVGALALTTAPAFAHDSGIKVGASLQHNQSAAVSGGSSQLGVATGSVAVGNGIAGTVNNQSIESAGAASANVKGNKTTATHDDLVTTQGFNASGSLGNAGAGSVMLGGGSSTSVGAASANQVKLNGHVSIH